MYSRSDIEELARKCRVHVIKMVHRTKASHVGSCFSIAELLAVLYSNVLQVRPNQPDWPGRDRFILSKGHAAAVLYAVLAEKGFFPVSWLDSFYHDDSILGGHVNWKVPGIEVSTGSLGHGLPIACGMALYAKRANQNHRIYVLLSDGELDEGSNWESALFAAQHHMDNLMVIVDANQFQGFGPVKDILNLEPIAEKWRAFGWEVTEVDGHNPDAIKIGLDKLASLSGSPKVMIAHTIKGKGVSFIQDRMEWHYKSPTDEQLAIALSELGESK